MSTPARRTVPPFTVGRGSQPDIFRAQRSDLMSPIRVSVSEGIARRHLSCGATKVDARQGTRSSQGETLVVEAKNFTDQTSIGGNGNGNGTRHSEAMTLTERFTRVDPAMILYPATINDPSDLHETDHVSNDDHVAADYELCAKARKCSTSTQANSEAGGQPRRRPETGTRSAFAE
jgi:hypothetical protein